MKQFREFHHYSSAAPGEWTRVERLEKAVVELLFDSTVPDEERESSVAFELKHSAAVIQFGRLLARRRGLDEDICGAGALLHDIYVITTGKYKDHAHNGGPIAQKMLEENGEFSDDEIQKIVSIVTNHSDKQIVSDDPYVEVGKDADVIDPFLYPGALDWYLANKSLPIFVHYLDRAKKLWNEMSMPDDPTFHLLDDYNDDWLSEPTSFDDLGDSDTADTFLVLPKTRQVWMSKSAVTSPSMTQVNEVSTNAHADTIGILVWPILDSFQALANDDGGKSRLTELSPSAYAALD